MPGILEIVGKMYVKVYCRRNVSNLEHNKPVVSGIEESDNDKKQ